jgi:GTP cyclohydrolase FolE2
VQQYAQDIYKLLKRSDAERVFSESERIFQFTKGLHREIAAQVTSQLTF